MPLFFTGLADTLSRSGLQAGLRLCSPPGFPSGSVASSVGHCSLISPCSPKQVLSVALGCWGCVLCLCSFLHVCAFHTDPSPFRRVSTECSRQLSPENAVFPHPGVVHLFPIPHLAGPLESLFLTYLLFVI